MTTWRIAWRNLWRNPRRTTLALAAIGLSVTLVLAYNALLRGYGDWMVATITGPMIGDLQVHAREWRKTRAMDKTLPRVSEMAAAIARDPEVSAVNARVYAPALAALGTEGFAVVVVGADIRSETAPQRLLAGSSVHPGPGQVLVGDLLARTMGVKAGDIIALVGQGADGSLANDLFTVAATVHTAVDLVNRQAIVMAIDQAQVLFAMPGEAHELMVYTRDPNAAGRVRNRLAAIPELGRTEVLDWQTLAPEMAVLVRLVESAWMIVLLLVFVAAAAGVANTMLMATFERTHEMGMLLALGVSPVRLVGMTVLEAITLGLGGASIGTVLGVALVAWGHRRGVDFAALTGGGPSELSAFGLNWSLRFYPALATIDVVRAGLAVVLTSLVASVWPALRVARLQPARALRE